MDCERIAIVSNRVALPGNHSAGGLASALEQLLEQHSGLWLGWSGGISDGADSSTAREIEAGNSTRAVVDLTPDEYERYYKGASNRTLWPLLHGRVDLSLFDADYEEAYQAVNEKMARLLAPKLRDRGQVWVHDYHLTLVGHYLRRAGVGLPQGFFLHTPFPPREVLATLPWHQRFLQGLCAYDLVGFQTEEDTNNFLDCVHHLAGGVVDHERATLQAFGRRVRAGAFPIGIDVDAWVERGRRAEARGKVFKYREELAGRRGVIAVDRLEYTKGLPERFDALRQLFEDKPYWRDEMEFRQIASPSRSDVPEYAELDRRVRRQARGLRHRFARRNASPVRLVCDCHDPLELAGLYRSHRVALVTPLKDGMNLVAKEFVAAQDPDDPGVLVLSRFAGAAQELRGRGALLVNPHDREQFAATIDHALEMPLEERRARWRRMFDAVRANSVHDWADAFVDQLAVAAPGRAGTPEEAAAPSSTTRSATAPDDWGRARSNAS